MNFTGYWIKAPGPGRIVLLPRPRGGDWLEDEIQAWKAAGIQVVVSALDNDEVSELDLKQEADLCRAHGIEFIAFPIPDRGMPSSIRSMSDLMRELENQQALGKTVAFHCRQGIGRSALLAASLLVVSGVDVDKAFERIATARGCPVPDTVEQREWVARFARDQMASAPSL